MANNKFIQSCLAACEAWGIIPTSFAQSMAWEEQVLWLSKFLQTQVIPVINGHTEAIKAIEHWLDNLDLQEEVDTKLEEMAESGELADIIAQYIQLAGVLAYNTVADMKAAENITEGSVAKTLGLLTYDDGKGSFYKVRTLTSGDVIDEVNIIALSVSDTLIAEKINDYYVDKNTEDIADNKEAIEDIQENLANKKYGLVAISRNVTDLKNFVYYSPDGEKFYRAGGQIPNFDYDSSAIIEIGHTYYYFGCASHKSFYCYSTDLVHWSEPALTLDTDSYNWAAYPFYDPVNNKYYIYSSLQYQSGSVTNAVGHEAYYFKIVRQEFTVNADKTLTIGATQDVKYVSNQSYIDPAVCYDSIHGYTIALKDEFTCKVELYNTNDLSNIGTAYATLDGAGTEGPQLIDEDGFITMYVHDYALNSMAVTGLDHDLGETYSSVLVATPAAMHNSLNLRRHCCQMPEVFRHAGVMACDKQTLDLVTSLGIKETPLFVCSDYSIHGDVKEMAGVWAGGATYNLPNLPYMLYLTGGGAGVNLITLNLKAYYDYDMHMTLGPTNVKFSGDASYEHTVTTAASTNDNITATLPLLKNKQINTPIAW
ncbi:MAG: hypothetical protein J6Q75_05985 [Bacteroidaceae bacterium]|nr:hypothetical protein [Bacteroidaceae bacterium]